MIWTCLKTRLVGSFRLGFKERQFAKFGWFMLVLTHPSSESITGFFLDS